MDRINGIEQQLSDRKKASTRGPDKGSLARARALSRIKPFAQTECNVLFEGEPGVGKKHHASVLHAHAHGKGRGAFVELMPETPEEIVRVILFDEDRRMSEGKHGKPLPTLEGRSTLHLREVGEFSLMNQVLISRFLIEQEKQLPFSATRVTASTTVPRGDLLRKLPNSLSRYMEQFGVCQLPPLRNRLDELPSLVEDILVEVRRREHTDCWRVTEETLRQLETRHWRDNVRELVYVVGDAAINSSDGTLRLRARSSDEIEIVWQMFRTIHAGKRLTIDESMASLERAIMERALLKCGFDQRKTARMLAMTEPNLTYRIRKFNIYIPSLK